MGYLKGLVWIFQFSFKDLLYQKKIYLFLIINLFIGTFGFLTIQMFQGSLKQDLAGRAQTMLGADYTIFASRQFRPEEVELFDKTVAFESKTSTIEFFAMLKAGDKSRLVSVRAFGQNYPFYGEIKSENIKLDYDSDKIWIDPELVTMLDLNLSQLEATELFLGKFPVKNIEIIEKDSTRFFRGAGLAPVIYLSQKLLSKTELLAEGSTSRNYLLYKLNKNIDLNPIKQNFYNQVTDSTVRFETAVERSQSSGSVFKYFSDYLGLVAIVAISLCFLSGGYLMRWAFQHQRKNIGIYKTLGMSTARIQSLYIIQVFIVSLAAFSFSLITFFILKPGINYYFTTENLPFQLSTTLEGLLFSLLISVVAPLFMFMPVNSAIAQLNPRTLFLSQNQIQKTPWLFYVWSALCLAGFWMLSFYQVLSYKTATLFTFAIIFIVILLKYSLSFLFTIIQRNIHRFSLHWSTRYAIKSVINKKNSADMVFITFTMAILVLTLLPHIKQSIISEIKPENPSALPKVFLFDLQSGQKDEIEKLAQDMLQAKMEFNPLVRSRILKVNDIDYDRLQENEGLSTREQEEEVRFRNRGVNLTYQTHLKASETIVSGKWNSEKYSGEGLPEISLERRYAGRINAKMGDVMLFDVQGLEIQGKVTSIRNIRWTSFNPNFFIVFQDGVLNEAPQNFLTSISTTKNYDTFQQVVVDRFPNVSIIDVSQTVKNVLIYVDQMALALQMMAVISIILGFFIFIVLVNTQIQERLNEFNLLKVMGTETSTIRKIIFKQFLFIVSLSLLAGLSLGLVLTQILIQMIFGITTKFDIQAMVVICVAMIPLVVLIVGKATGFLNRLSPIDLIRS